MLICSLCFIKVLVIVLEDVLSLLNTSRISVSLFSILNWWLKKLTALHFNVKMQVSK